MRNIKRRAITVLLTLAVLMSLLLSGCRYDVPEGYTTKHHTYDELVEFAKSIDPGAKVTDKCQEVTYQYREYRIWPAVINGVECNVASIQQNLYNTDFYPGEFAKKFYRMDTDYDFYVVNKCLKEHPGLGQVEENLFARFDKILYGVIDSEPMTEEELKHLWDEHDKVIEELSEYNLRKTYRIRICIGGKYYWVYKDEETYDNLHDKMSKAGVLKESQ